VPAFNQKIITVTGKKLDKLIHYSELMKQTAKQYKIKILSIVCCIIVTNVI